MSTSARRTHVAVDVRLATAAGHRTYLRNLVPRMARLAPEWQWSLVGDAAFLRGEDWAKGDNVAHVDCTAPVYSVREQVELPLRVPRDAHLFWGPHYNAPLALPTRMVLTIHDAAHLRLPEYTAEPLRHTYARLMFAGAMARASAIVCVSEFTRRELAELVGVSAPVQVVHNGVDDAWFRGADGTVSPVAPPYFVCVGSLKPHKNVRTLLAAFRALQGQVVERLVIVGKLEGLRTKDAAAHEEITALGDRVVLAGELADAPLRALVRNATALVMPSIYEGFGLPPLEAMALGCPAIVSRAASLPEVCGDAAVYFDALDAGALSRTMLTVSKDPAYRASLVEPGRTRARRFSWDTSARGTLDVLRSALPPGR